MADTELERYQAMVEGFNKQGPLTNKLLTFASTGRQFAMSYPADLTDEELLDLLGFCTHQLRASLPQTGEYVNRKEQRLAIGRVPWSAD